MNRSALIRRHCPPSYGERGNILPGILVGFILIMVVVTTLINNFAVTEEEAIERSLAEIRGYWAMQGVVDYSLSRLRRDAVGTNATASKIALLSSYAGASSANLVDYFSGTSTLYRFKVASSITTAGAATQGYLTMTLSLAAVSTTQAPVLNGVVNTLKPLELGLCIGETLPAARTLGGSCVGLASSVTKISTVRAYRRR